MTKKKEKKRKEKRDKDDDNDVSHAVSARQRWGCVVGGERRVRGEEGIERWRAVASSVLSNGMTRE